MALIAPGYAVAQEQLVPPFDSFSYLNNPLFSPARLLVTPSNASGQAVDANRSVVENSAANDEGRITGQATPECPSTDILPRPLDNNDFETRLAIDKALSQILKLTVDYGALRNRVSNLCQPAAENDQSWFAFGQKGTQGEQQLEALQQINQKQIADRDKQLALLQTRLGATQKRYDNENVARLLAEKRLKIAQDGVKKNKANVAKTNRKVQTLAEQLEQNQILIRQLKIDLTDEKRKLHRLTADQGERGDPTQDTLTSALKPVIGAKVNLLAMSPASEWLIEGLEFEQGSAEIKLESADNLKKLLDYLIKKPQLHIQINGYTDSVGSAASNLKLSQNRAQAVAEYLQQHGIDQSQVKVLGYGERRPIANNETESGRVSNRRVAVLFLN